MSAGVISVTVVAGSVIILVVVAITYYCGRKIIRYFKKRTAKSTGAKTTQSTKDIR